VDKEEAPASTSRSFVNPPTSTNTENRLQVVATSPPLEPQTIGSLGGGESSRTTVKTDLSTRSTSMAVVSREATALKDSPVNLPSRYSVRKDAIISLTPFSPFAIHNQQFPPNISPRSQARVSARPVDPFAPRKSQSPLIALTRQPAVGLDRLSADLRDNARERSTGANETRNRSAPEAGRRQLPDGSLPQQSVASAGPSVTPPSGSGSPTSASETHWPKSNAPDVRSTRPRLATIVSARPRNRLSPGPLAAAGPSRSPESQSCALRLGIETEFLLSARRSQDRAATMKEFVKLLAANHNQELPNSPYQMHHSLELTYQLHDYTEWTIVREATIEDGMEPLCKSAPYQVI
jgi:hypothetical protein